MNNNSKIQKIIPKIIKNIPNPKRKAANPSSTRHIGIPEENIINPHITKMCDNLSLPLTLASISIFSFYKITNYIKYVSRSKNKIDEQQEEQEFDECMKKINQPNRTSFNVNELPPILQDMVNGVYREEFRYDPFRPRPEREK